MTKKEQRSAKRAQAAEVASSLAGLKWLGTIITWTSGPDGSVHKQTDVTSALAGAGLDPKISRELAPRNAWSRAAKELADKRVIDVFSDTDSEIVFQFTRKHLNSSQWEFRKESFVTLNKATGAVTADDPDLAISAQTEVDKAMETRTTVDITRIVQKLFEEHADLIPLREAGGVYFVPQAYTTFVDKVDLFLNGLKGRIDRFPVPEGTDAGDKAIQNAVSSTMDKLIQDHMEAIEGFETNTRKDTIHRAAEKISYTRIKIEAYANYLGDRQKELLKKVKSANDLLKMKVEEIGGGTATTSTLDWDSILDGKVHKLVRGEDFEVVMGTMCTQLRVHAKDRGLKMRISVKEDTVIFQAVKSDVEMIAGAK